jgi:hypothetical protein
VGGFDQPSPVKAWFPRQRRFSAKVKGGREKKRSIVLDRKRTAKPFRVSVVRAMRTASRDKPLPRDIADGRAKESGSAGQNKPVDGRHDLDRSKSVGRGRSHIPRETLHQLVARDGVCCSYVSDGGVRCTARAFLEIDHRQPWARFGSDALGNLRFLCRAHNQLSAEETFGKSQVRDAIAQELLRRAGNGE